MYRNELTPTVEEVVSNSVILSSKTQLWHGIEVMQAQLNVNQLVVPALASHTVVINIGQSFNLDAKIDGRNKNGIMNNGNVKIVSAGVGSEWEWAEGTSLSVLHLSLTDTFTREVVNGIDLNPDNFEIISKVGFQDLQIQQLGAALLSELRSGGLGGKIYTESLTNILAIHLLRNYSSLGQLNNIHSYKGPLSKQALQLVTDYISANLAQNLRLAELAALVNLSPYYFSRLFKQSTGLAPYQFVIKCRVERAKLLLITTDLPLQEVALQVGFADQSHLNRHFRQHFGITPAYLRKT